MGTRIDLQSKLEGILGSKNVYFQPPESVKLVYPCIIYSRAPGRYFRADNGIHFSRRRYDVTVIHRDPDSDYVERMMSLPYCSYNRRFVADNLYHDAFELYY